ncbi:hypothetical protein BGM09_01360 [Streptomyces sp. CBMA29]|nr:hypothetical protein [Streptomyces sp. CBMA29]
MGYSFEVVGIAAGVDAAKVVDVPAVWEFLEGGHFPGDDVSATGAALGEADFPVAVGVSGAGPQVAVVVLGAFVDLVVEALFE